MITASADDRRDLAHHHAGVPQGVLQALIAFVSITLTGNGVNECESYELGFVDL